MTQAILAKESQVMDSRYMALPQLSDLTLTAENALIHALEFSAQQMDLDPLAVAQRIRSGNKIACICYRYGLAKQVAEALGGLDGNIKAVYTRDYNTIPVDLSFDAEIQRTPPIRLLVWMQPETAVFDSLVEALDRALIRGFADILGVRGPVSLLNVQVIGDADVEKLISYGALFASVYHRLVRCWEH